jgi:predicted acylesterase/phospholipase RssA/CRP-like cAMP-binding protein
MRDVNHIDDGTGVIDILGQIPLFRDLAPELLAMVASEVTARHAPAGTVLFQMEDDGDEMFVVARGMVQIVLPGESGAEEVVAELGEGRWFGEMALITGEPRSATARVLVDSELLRLTRASFHLLLARIPVLALRLSEELSHRLRGRLVASTPHAARRFIVLDDRLETPESGAWAADLAAAIAAELDGNVVYVDLDGGMPARANGRLRHQLCRDRADVDRLRGSHDTIVLRAPRSHALSDPLRALPEATVDAAAMAAARIGETRAPAGILADPLQRHARRIIGRRVGLVLGAGGAKGLAHVGALRSFERAGVRFDMLAGTSMGGIIAALIGLGWSSDRLLEFAERLRRSFRSMLVDIGLSGSLLRGVKKRALLADLAGGRRFEDLDVPLWIVAADLVLQREFVFEQGDLGTALDATSAIPAVFPVVALEDRQLVDGWVVNPLPADVLRRKGADVVIAVDPNVADERKPRPHTGHRRRAWWKRLLSPQMLIDPMGMVRVQMQAMDVGARERTMANLALTDVCVQPGLGAYSTTDVRKLPAIIAAGEAAAESALPAIRAVLCSGRAAV